MLLDRLDGIHDDTPDEKDDLPSSLENEAHWVKDTERVLARNACQ